jgi:uncharacterized membrane protein (DUF106 family)
MDFWTIVVLAILLLTVIAYVISLIYEDKAYENFKKELEKSNKQIEKIENELKERVKKLESEKTTKKK